MIRIYNYLCILEDGAQCCTILVNGIRCMSVLRQQKKRKKEKHSNVFGDKNSLLLTFVEKPKIQPNVAGTFSRYYILIRKHCNILSRIYTLRQYLDKKFSKMVWILRI